MLYEVITVNNSGWAPDGDKDAPLPEPLVWGRVPTVTACNPRRRAAFASNSIQVERPSPGVEETSYNFV